jgi:hypothetical protein
MGKAQKTEHFGGVTVSGQRGMRAWEENKRGSFAASLMRLIIGFM